MGSRPEREVVVRLNVELNDELSGIVKNLPHGWTSTIVRNLIEEVGRVREQDNHLFLRIVCGQDGWEIGRKGG